MNLILKATEYNWGLKYPGCWKSKTWKVYEDGTCDINVDYVLSESVSGTASIPAPDLSRLRGLRYAAWENELRRACDGTAWIITAYENGKTLQTTGKHPRYIYGLQTLEEISRLLPEIDMKRGD